MRKLLALFLCCVSYANAALTFSGTNLVNFGTGAALEAATTNAGTIIAWVFTTSISGNGRFVGHTFAVANYTFNPGATTIQMNIPRATTSLLARSNLTDVPLYAINKWVFLAATYDTAGSNGQQQLWNGDLTHVVAENSAYASQLVGTGTVTPTSSDPIFVGNEGGGTIPFAGKISFVAMWNRRLTLGELKAQQFAPHVTSGCVLFSWLGYNGTGTQADWSGLKNNGTVTGATVSTGVPIAPFSALLRRVFPVLPAWWLPSR